MDGSLMELGYGKYRCRVSFVDENGKRVQKSKTFTAPGKKDARQIMKNFKDECQKNIVPQVLFTLNDLYKSFEKYHCCNVQDSTKQTYGYSWKLLEPYHSKKLNTIKPNVIRAMLTLASQDSRSQKGIYQLLTAMYGYAVSAELLNYNPTIKVKAPKYKSPEKKILTEKQVEKLDAVIVTQPEKYQLIYYMTLTLGFRRSEICALKWSDIDFENKTLHINRVAVYLDKKGTTLKTPAKTEKSKTPLPLADEHIFRLEKYKTYSAKEKKRLNINTDFLFYRDNGEIINVQTVSNWFKAFFRKNGLDDDLTLHCLRHTAASRMLQAGIDIATVADIIRDTIETVAKTYLHTNEDVKRAAVEKMAAQKGNKREIGLRIV